MSEETWYYVDGSQRIGPVSLPSLKKLILGLADSEDLLVWREGFPDWKLAGEVQELRGIRPPPVPEMHGAEPMPEWQIRWWWYVVAIVFFGSIGSQDGRRAMAWASSMRAARKRLDRKPKRVAAPDGERTGLSRIFAREIRNPAILGASILYGLYLGLQKPPILFGLATGAVSGAIVGAICVGVAEVIARLMRAFREKLPRTAFYVGTSLFWLGIAAAVWFAGLSGYVLYESGPIRIVALLAGCAAAYGFVAWGVRLALVK